MVGLVEPGQPRKGSSAAATDSRRRGSYGLGNVTSIVHAPASANAAADPATARGSCGNGRTLAEISRSSTLRPWASHSSARIDRRRRSSSASSPSSSSGRRSAATSGSVRRSPLPPMTIGGCGCCCALGSHQASRSWYERPSKVVVRCVRSERMTISASSNRSKRSGQRSQLDAIGLALGLEPPCPETQLEPPAGRDVDRHRHVGQHGRVPVGDARDQDPTPQPAGAGQEHGQADPALERRLLRPGPERIEVVVGPPGTEELDVLRHLPHGPDLVPGAVGLRGRRSRSA